jgi:PHS family inorganic phosphate transporter-like MFS transporter
VEAKWRIILGLGAVPALLVVIGTVLESRIEQSMRVVRSDTVKPVGGPSLWESLQDRKNCLKLVASGGGWFIYDVAFYGVNLFAGQILSSISGDDDNVSSDASIRNLTGKQLIANSVTIPAVVLTIALLKPIGIKRLQVVGFVLIALAFTLMAALFDPLEDRNPDLLFAFYCLLLFFLSFGTNVTTYILSAELYSKDIRSTFNGIYAALGKVGAAVGAYLFDSIGNVTAVMVMCAVISIIGAIVSEYFIDIESSDSADSDYVALSGNATDDMETSRRGGNRSK